MTSLPAHVTKHIPSLSYSFRSLPLSLAQVTDGVSNGTALWLGGQCLALYLAQMHTKFRISTGRPRAIELGSGIGLTALALSSLGWDVLATDISHVISTVLQTNIQNNLANLPVGSGIVQVKELDWTVLPESWSWDDPRTVASSSSLPPVDAGPEPANMGPPFDLIYSADTIYSSDLVEPLLRTLQALSKLSTSQRPPTILLCIERRDPLLVDRLLADAKERWEFSVERIPHKKLAKAIEKGGVHWAREDWEGVELWKLRLELK